MKKIAAMIALLPVCGWAQNYPFCQILDRVETPPWEVHLAYISEADVSGPAGDKFSIVRVDGGGGIGYYRTRSGDFDITGGYQLQWLTDDGGIGLPDNLAAVSINASYALRNPEGQALKLTLSPSLRNDLQEFGHGALTMPVEILGIQAFSPEVSGMIGVAFFPWYDHWFDPRFGLRIAPVDMLVIDLMYPESKIAITPVEGWDIYMGVRMDRTAEWAIDDSRDRLNMEETRAYVGLNHPVTDTLRMMYQAGVAFNREVNFKKHQSDMDVDDSVFVRVGIGGPL